MLFKEIIGPHFTTHAVSVVFSDAEYSGQKNIDRERDQFLLLQMATNRIENKNKQETKKNKKKEE